MTQPPTGPNGPGNSGDDSVWGGGPGNGPNQPGWGDQTPREPTWGGQSGDEPTWSGAPGAAPQWGQTPPPHEQPRYEQTAEYQAGQYGAGYGATPPPPGATGPTGYGPPPDGSKPPSKTPWIIGIAAAAVIVVVLGVVLFLTLGKDDSDPIADPESTATTSQSSQSGAEQQIEDSIRTYTVSFTDADWDTALSVTCDAEQDIIRDLQADSSDVAGMQLNSVTGITIDGDTAEATVSLTFVDPADPSTAETSSFTFTMENRSGTWRICDTREI